MIPFTLNWKHVFHAKHKWQQIKLKWLENRSTAENQEHRPKNKNEKNLKQTNQIHCIWWCTVLSRITLSAVLTGNGSEDIRDEDFYQALVQAVVTVAAPAQHGLVFAQQNQAGFGEAFLWLVVANPHTCMQSIQYRHFTSDWQFSENQGVSSTFKTRAKFRIISTHTANVASPAWLWLNLQKVFQRVSTRVNCRLTITSSIA